MTPDELRKLADDLARGAVPMGAAYKALRDAAAQIEKLQGRVDALNVGDFTPASAKVLDEVAKTLPPKNKELF